MFFLAAGSTVLPKPAQRVQFKEPSLDRQRGKKPSLRWLLGTLHVANRVLHISVSNHPS